jgi:hypothetical protein
VRTILLDDRNRNAEIMRPVGHKAVTIWRPVRLR